jgi:two-component system nitrate/nitrite response regulator NarL
MRVLVVDDHVLFREGLVWMLDRQLDFEVVGEAGSIREAIELTRARNPDLILLDLFLPGENGMDAISAIRSDRPETKIVVLTFHKEHSLALMAFRSGANGYIQKDISTSSLIASLRAVQRGEAAISREMAGRMVDEFSRIELNVLRKEDLDRLTPRELDILEQLRAHATNHEIASSLSISEHTVKSHVSNILKKLHLRRRQQAALLQRNHLL